MQSYFELTFLQDPAAFRTRLWKYQASDVDFSWWGRRSSNGLRLMAEWHSLVITVASQLCMGQQRRNRGSESEEDGGCQGDEQDARALYGSLQHVRVAARDPG